LDAVAGVLDSLAGDRGDCEAQLGTSRRADDAGGLIEQ
jgi:hypothetical protein